MRAYVVHARGGGDGGGARSHVRRNARHAHAIKTNNTPSVSLDLIGTRKRHKNSREDRNLHEFSVFSCSPALTP